MEATIKIIESATSVKIVFNRPKIRSPISTQVIAELEAALEHLRTNKQLTRLVFTGRNGVFASGADLREIDNLAGGQVTAFARRGQALMNKIAGMPFTTIAAVNGFCFGGALDLALSCDARVATKGATFAHPGARLGIITGWGGTQRLPRLVGHAVALEMLLTAEPISAEDALRVGLIDRVIAESDTDLFNS